MTKFFTQFNQGLAAATLVRLLPRVIQAPVLLVSAGVSSVMEASRKRAEEYAKANEKTFVAKKMMAAVDAMDLVKANGLEGLIPKSYSTCPELEKMELKETINEKFNQRASAGVESLFNPLYLPESKTLKRPSVECSDVVPKMLIEVRDFFYNVSTKSRMDSDSRRTAGLTFRLLQGVIKQFYNKPLNKAHIWVKVKSVRKFIRATLRTGRSVELYSDLARSYIENGGYGALGRGKSFQPLKAIDTVCSDLENNFYCTPVSDMVLMVNQQIMLDSRNFLDCFSSNTELSKIWGEKIGSERLKRCLNRVNEYIHSETVAVKVSDLMETLVGISGERSNQKSVSAALSIIGCVYRYVYRIHEYDHCYRDIYKALSDQFENEIKPLFQGDEGAFNVPGVDTRLYFLMSQYLKNIENSILLFNEFMLKQNDDVIQNPKRNLALEEEVILPEEIKTFFLNYKIKIDQDIEKLKEEKPRQHVGNGVLTTSDFNMKTAKLAAAKKLNFEKDLHACKMDFLRYAEEKYKEVFVYGDICKSLETNKQCYIVMNSADFVAVEARQKTAEFANELYVALKTGWKVPDVNAKCEDEAKKWAKARAADICRVAVESAENRIVGAEKDFAECMYNIRQKEICNVNNRIYDLNKSDDSDSQDNKNLIFMKSRWDRFWSYRTFVEIQYKLNFKVALKELINVEEKLKEMLCVSIFDSSDENGMDYVACLSDLIGQNFKLSDSISQQDLGVALNAMDSAKEALLFAEYDSLLAQHKENINAYINGVEERYRLEQIMQEGFLGWFWRITRLFNSAYQQLQKGVKAAYAEMCRSHDSICKFDKDHNIKNVLKKNVYLAKCRRQLWSAARSLSVRCLKTKMTLIEQDAVAPLEQSKVEMKNNPILLAQAPLTVAVAPVVQVQQTLPPKKPDSMKSILAASNRVGGPSKESLGACSIFNHDIKGSWGKFRTGFERFTSESFNNMGGMFN